MVECKTSIYDEPEPPLVPAMLAPNTASAPPPQEHNDTGGIPHAPHCSAPSPRKINKEEGPTTTTTNSPDDDEPEPPLVPATLAPNEGSALPQEHNDTEGISLPHSVPTTSPRSNEGPTRTTESPDDKEMMASGTAGAVLGFFLGGPLIAALLGFGAAYATQKPGAPGDAARALGDVAISTKEKAKELDGKHHIVDRSKKAATEAWEQAKEYDRQHNVLDTVRDAIIFIWGAFVNFVQEHRLLERGVAGVGCGYEYLVERLSGEIASNNDANRPREKAKEYDRRHNVLDTVKDAIIFIWGAIVKFVQEHRLLERGINGVGRGYEYMADRVSGESKNDDANRPETARANAT
jgi:hypothetical protein